MSTLKRFNLLDPILGSLNRAWPNGDTIIDINDIYTVRQAFKVWLTTTSDILFKLGYSTPSVNNRIYCLANAIINTEQPSKWLLASKIAYDIFIDFVSLKKHISSNFYIEFKAQLVSSGIDNDIVDALVAPINRVISNITDCGKRINGCWLSNCEVSIESVAQYFGFLMKLELTRPDLEEKALADYLSFEENYFQFDLKCNRYAPALKRILTDWLKEYRYNGDRCRHGNGSVANTNKAKLDKYQRMSLDTRLEYLFKRESLNGINDYLPLVPLPNKLERCSKLQFVPKNISKLRSISMEPASLQFVQQGVMLSLYDYIDTHRTLSTHIKLGDQGQNKSFAYDGSITNRYSTIDLSAASDSVSYDLAKYLFSGLPEVWRWLVGTRSDHTLLPDGTKLKLKKFAPMGSAICFPIETLIFAAIAKLSVALGHEQGRTQDVETGIYNDYYTVYGDDIIIPSGVYDLTVDILHSFGFSINEQKSYNDSPFKESCGGNYHCGNDITPIKWTCNVSKSNKIDIENYTAICSIINALYQKEYKVTRCYLIQLIREQGYIPLFTDQLDQNPMIYSPTPTNFHCKKHWRKNLQCFEVNYTTLKTSPLVASSISQNSDKDAILYLEWLRKSNQRSEPGQRPLFLKNRHTGLYEFNEVLPSTEKSLVLTKAVRGKGRLLCYN